MAVKDNGNHNATFVLKVKFQQNATWQGSITWVEENRSQNFRSELEMMKLMMEAMRIEDQITYNTWD